MTYAAQAKEFFNQDSSRYRDQPAVLYEICSEPNGNVSWEHDIKPYAEEVVNVIRFNSGVSKHALKGSRREKRAQ